MLQLILTGQAKSLSLLLWAVMLFIYFLPSLLAFVHGHRRFFGHDRFFVSGFGFYGYPWWWDWGYPYYP